jgi:YfiH family protein
MRNGFSLNEQGELRAELFQDLDWLDHAFGTRNAPLPGWPLATVKQIHSGDVIDAGGIAGVRGEGDALISGESGLAIGVKTADCLPILMVDEDNRVTAAVHAGWRGTAKSIVATAIKRMGEKYGTKPEGVRAAIGPGIGKCCFEVGPEVVLEFSRWVPKFARTGGQQKLDLAAINTSQLLEVGVSADNIASCDLCTMDRTDMFYSFRKEREAAGRMLAWVAMRRPYKEKRRVTTAPFES